MNSIDYLEMNFFITLMLCSCFVVDFYSVALSYFYVIA